MERKPTVVWTPLVTLNLCTDMLPKDQRHCTGMRNDARLSLVLCKLEGMSMLQNAASEDKSALNHVDTAL